MSAEVEKPKKGPPSGAKALSLEEQAEMLAKLYSLTEEEARERIESLLHMLDIVLDNNGGVSLGRHGVLKTKIHGGKRRIEHRPASVQQREKDAAKNSNS